MTGTDERREEDRLRRLLRRGDPAGESEGIPAPALARMRARVVGAAEARPRPLLGPFVWATAGAAGLLLLVALALRPGAPSSSPLPEPRQSVTVPTPSMPAGPEAAMEPPPPAVVASGVSPGPIAPGAPRRDVGHRGRAATIVEPTPLSSSPTVAAAAAPALDLPQPPVSARKPLTVQFTTPAGTRIIWKLDPEFEG